MRTKPKLRPVYMEGGREKAKADTRTYGQSQSSHQI